MIWFVLHSILIDSGFVGVDSFTYTASDGIDVSNVATVIINVG